MKLEDIKKVDIYQNEIEGYTKAVYVVTDQNDQIHYLSKKNTPLIQQFKKQCDEEGIANNVITINDLPINMTHFKHPETDTYKAFVEYSNGEKAIVNGTDEYKEYKEIFNVLYGEDIKDHCKEADDKDEALAIYNNLADKEIEKKVAVIPGVKKFKKRYVAAAILAGLTIAGVGLMHHLESIKSWGENLFGLKENSTSISQELDVEDYKMSEETKRAVINAMNTGANIGQNLELNQETNDYSSNNNGFQGGSTTPGTTGTETPQDIPAPTPVIPSTPDQAPSIVNPETGELWEEVVTPEGEKVIISQTDGETHKVDAEYNAETKEEIVYNDSATNIPAPEETPESDIVTDYETGDEYTIVPGTDGNDNLVGNNTNEIIPVDPDVFDFSSLSENVTNMDANTMLTSAEYVAPVTPVMDENGEMIGAMMNNDLVAEVKTR